MKKIHLPKPCHEDWNRMTPTEKGRFCASCTKEVVDFREMTFPEIEAQLATATGPSCGHFRRDQVHTNTRVYEPVVEKPSVGKFKVAYRWWLSTLALIGATLSDEKATAQGTWSGTPIPAHEEGFYLNAAPVVVKGVIRDSTDGAPIAGVDVSFESNGRPIASTFSDSLGRWKVLLEADQLHAELLTINCFRSGFDTVVLRDYPIRKEEVVFNIPMLRLETNEDILGSPVFVWNGQLDSTYYNEVVEWREVIVTSGVTPYVIDINRNLKLEWETRPSDIFALGSFVVPSQHEDSSVESNVPSVDLRTDSNVEVTDAHRPVEAAENLRPHTNPDPEPELPVPPKSSAILTSGSAFNYLLYPNPTRDRFALQMEVEGTYLVQIFDLKGELCAVSNFTGKRHEMDVTELAPGQYLVRVTDHAAELQHVEKLLIQ